MPDAIEGLPNWTVKVEEISMGMYKVMAVHASGSTIHLTGTDPKDLIRQIKSIAPRMQNDSKKGAGTGS
jgi:hypothetical protein